jgi:2-polyprenyl-6-hydroxyphenyl methylase / 3-demethylubiquinone-9 3-methyltransferase
VLAMEVVEHVADVQAFVNACAKAVRPGGCLAMATLNRTAKSFAFAIVGAEYVLGWLPKGTHEWDKFVTPEELHAALRAAGFIVHGETGVSYNPLTATWSLSRDMGVNYMLVAARR